MFGVIIEVGINPNREGEARAMVHDVIVAKAKSHPGFLGAYWLRALRGDILRSVHLFDTQANAQATASRISSEGPPPDAPVTLHSVDAYEVIAQA